MTFHNNTCRVCKQYGGEYQAKYSVRHYAHFACGLKRWGAEFLNMIPLHEVGRMPFMLADEYGLNDHPRLVEYRKVQSETDAEFEEIVADAAKNEALRLEEYFPAPAQPMQDEASSGAKHRPGESLAWQPERSEGASAPDASQASAPFTPGPWHMIGGESSTSSCFYVQTDAMVDGSGYIAKGSWFPNHPDESHPSKEVSRANFHLIAAAPSLVDASMSTVERLADLPRFLRQNYNTVIAGIVEEELAKHAAAIAKAVQS